MSKAKFVIANSDDFGQNVGITRGIILAHKKGIVTSTSLMINMPRSRFAARIAKSCPKLSVGLHINLTYGRPVSNLDDVPSLIDKNGYFRRPFALKANPSERYIKSAVSEVVRNFAAKANPLDIAKEINAQFDLFAEILGRFPSHLDSHHHIHRLPRVLRVISKLAHQNQIPVRQIDSLMRSYLRTNGVRTTDRFIDRFWGVSGSTDMSSRLGAIFGGLPIGVTEILFHPGFDTKYFADREKLLYTNERAVELRVLCDPSLENAIEQANLQLISYADMSRIQA